MFTGLVEKKTRVLSLEGKSLTVENPFAKEPLKLGQSISVSGCCLTVVAWTDSTIVFDVSPETFSKTRFGALTAGDFVNLERSLKVGSPMDGHWVTGHVDTTALVKDIVPLPDGMKRLVFELRGSPMKWLVEKGSVSLDGVSLTINEVLKESFSVTLIPHTLKMTSLGDLNIGDALNLEFDLFAKYVEKMIQTNSPPQREAAA